MGLTRWQRQLNANQALAETVTLTIDQNSLNNALARLNYDKKRTTKAIVRAMNKVIVTARKEVVQEVRKTLNVNPSLLRTNYIKIVKASASRKTASMRIANRPLRIGMFYPQRTGAGVSYRILKGGKVEYKPGWFINISAARKKQGKVPDVMERSGKLRESARKRGRRYVRPRYPIERKMGPGLYTALPGIAGLAKTRYEAKLHERFAMELERQVTVILEGKDQKRSAA